MFSCTNGHPDFTTSPRYILTKQSGCPVCGVKRAGKKNTKSQVDFIHKLESRNQKYKPVLLVPGEVYLGVHHKLRFSCTNVNHPPWEATPVSILAGHGCPMCGRDVTKTTHQHTHIQFIELLDIRNTKYPHKQVFLSPNQQYVSQREKLEFYCSNVS